MSERFGMYVPQMEHDACGIGFISHFKAKPSHKIVEKALVMLGNMEHRGGQSVDERSGDGAGVLQGRSTTSLADTASFHARFI